MDDKEILEKIKDQNLNRIQAMKELRKEVSNLQKQTAVQAEQMKRIEELQKEIETVQTKLEDIDHRISNLESFQNKLVGGLTLSHIALGALLVLL